MKISYTYILSEVLPNGASSFVRLFKLHVGRDNMGNEVYVRENDGKQTSYTQISEEEFRRLKSKSEL